MAQWESVSESNESALNSGHIPGTIPRVKLQPGPRVRENGWGAPKRGGDRPGNPTLNVQRRFRVVEDVFGNIEYTGEGQEIALRQAWDRCDPNPDSAARWISGGDSVPARGNQTDPTNDSPPPDTKKKFHRQGRLFLQGYKVEGVLYKRRQEEWQESTKPSGDKKWGPWKDMGPRNITWKFKRIGETSRPFPLIQWQPWVSGDCELGLEDSSYGLLEQEPESFAMSITVNADDLTQPGIYGVHDYDFSAISGDALVNATHLALRVDHSANDVRFSLVDQHEEDGEVEIGTFTFRVADA